MPFAGADVNAVSSWYRDRSKWFSLANVDSATLMHLDL